MYISELINKIDIKISANGHVIAAANDEIERLKLVKQSIQTMCLHKHKDGSDAFTEYGTTHNRSLQRCAICQMEVTV
jgi:hypothetical protein